MASHAASVSNDRANEVLRALGPAVSTTTHPLGSPTYISPQSSSTFATAAAFREWFAEREDEFERLLAQCGAIVFRGFPVGGTTDFAALIDHYPTDEMGYSGGAATRSAISGKVFEATRMPADMKLPLHQEMAYLPRWPAKLAFYCHVAPATGGATIIADVRQFEQEVPAALLDNLRARGILYLRNFRSPGPFVRELEETHRTWQEAFYTTDPAKVEADCSVMGVGMKWEQDGSVTTSYRAPGFITHPITGTFHWFNHLQSMTVSPYSMKGRWELYKKTYSNGVKPPYDVRFGDGGEIPLEQVTALFPKLDAVTVASPWQVGDVMFVDNIMTMHGRDPYTGSREIQVALLWGKSS